MTTPLYLAADIGGTYARFSLLDANGSRLSEQKLLVADYAELADAIQATLEVSGVTRPLAAAILAVAGPVDAGTVPISNSNWLVRREMLKQKFGWRQLLVLNDFEAAAYGVGQADTAHWQLGGPEQAQRCFPMAVIGPGTGFGVAAVVANESGWQVMPGEGGHARFAPDSEQEIEILRLLRRRLGGVQREDILSGRGLCNLYWALAEVEGKAVIAVDDPAAITAAALQQRDGFSAEVLNLFCAILGAAAADIALDLGSRGGVYIGGGMVPRFADFLAASAFRSRFEDHPCFGDYLRKIPTFLVTCQEPGLLGAEYVLRRMLVDDQL